LIALAVTCDQQCIAVIHCSAAAQDASRSKIFPSAFSTLFCYSGWAQLVPVIKAGYLLFSACWINYRSHKKHRSS